MPPEQVNPPAPIPPQEAVGPTPFFERKIVWISVVVIILLGVGGYFSYNLQSSPQAVSEEGEQIATLHSSLGREISEEEFEARMQKYHSKVHFTRGTTSGESGELLFSWRNDNNPVLLKAIRDWDLDDSLKGKYTSTWREYHVTKDLNGKSYYIYLNDTDFDLKSAQALAIHKYASHGEMVLEESRILPRGPWLMKGFNGRFSCSVVGCSGYVETEMQIAEGRVFMGIYSSNDYVALPAEKAGIYFFDDQKWVQAVDATLTSNMDGFTIDNSGCVVSYPKEGKYFELNVCTL